jgi:hypothetical protein
MSHYFYGDKTNEIDILHNDRDGYQGVYRANSNKILYIKMTVRWVPKMKDWGGILL